MLDLFMVSIALPGIVDAFVAGPTVQLWILNGQTVIFAAFLLFSGNLADRIGAKRAFTSGILLLMLASLGAAISPLASILIAARCVQGFSAALILPSSMSLLREAFPDPVQRVRALGFWAIGGAVATAVGPPLGGLFVGLSWNLVFLVNVPVGVVVLLLGRGIQRSPARSAPVDWLGQTIAVLTLVSLTAGLIHGGSAGMFKPWVILLFVVTVIGIVFFVFVEKRQAHPLLPLSLFKPRNLRLIFTVGVTYTMSWYGTVLVLSIFLQQHLGLTALAAGYVFLPAAVFAAYSNVLASQLTVRYGPRLPATIGQLSVISGSGALIWAATLESPTGIAFAFAFVAIGGGMTLPPLLALLLSTVPASQTGIATGALNTSRQIGGSIAVAVFGSLITDAHYIAQGARLTFIVGAAIAFCTLMLVLLIQPATNRNGENDV